MFKDLNFPLSLGSDNHSGVHPEVFKALEAANRGHAHAYGLDEVSKLAEQEFQRVFGKNVLPEYVFTGTAANVLSLSLALKSFEAVICSEQAHLQLDECAAPEKFVGCKLLCIKSIDGKIRPQDIEPLLNRRGDQHCVQPKIVSLTLPSELGVTYTLEELRDLREYTKERQLLLHIDGARLANAAVHLNCSLRDLTSEIGVDVVSFGGTKNGLLGADAILVFNEALKANIKFYRKQAMQLSSKTRFLAAQFYAYLKNDLWREIARQVVNEAKFLAQELHRLHPELPVAFPVESNAVFVHVPKSLIKPLRNHNFFYIWDQQHSLCRWMISFDWTRADTLALLKKIDEEKYVLKKNELS